MLINQFNTDATLMSIVERHHAWHTFPGGAHGFPSRTFPQGSPGSGTEFLTFHRNLMGEFFTWNNVNHAATATQISAWTAIPPILKADALWSAVLAAAETRINNNSPAFADQDALGIHIETTIHNWIHGAVGRSALPMDAGEPNIISQLHSVESTYFYQIHGLVQYWWDQWSSSTGFIPKRVKDAIDVVHKHRIKDSKDHLKEGIKEHIKEFIKEHKEFIHDGGKHFIKDIKEKDKDKDMVENPFDPGIFQIDPAINILQERLTKLENVVKGAAFIKEEERPNVGNKSKG